ncbi:MAG TPA: M23 family metallopeptidase [Syntrophales bacterium]|nr:M23 family metallopeptidase [Syntrophales bacterium]HOM06474.1 M23 family metallopeptidase [Syntrophales bacterium]HPQ05846.1 M23 family metallopeptidase [Syntrophales bacterium]
MMDRLWESTVGKWGFVLAMMLLFLTPSTGWTEEKIDVRYLVQGKKVIPVTCSIGHWEITDIKLPDLVVTNGQKTPVTVEQIDVIGKVSGTETVRLQISGKPLSEAIKETAEMLNKKKLPLPTVQLSLGNVVLPEGMLSENGTAVKGQSILLPLSKIAYLHHVGHMKIDGMEIKVTSKSGKKKTVHSFPVQLTPYQAKGKYIFPLKGDVQMAYLPLSYIHHRGSAPQEFAMDVVGANQKDAASFTDISRPKPKTLSDYSIWGREILAIGDGVVAEIGDRFPEERMSDPAQFGKPGYAIGLIKELIPKIGWTNAVAGNYVVIDHENGEFSVYCHLQEGSIRVKPGERVKKAMVIAKVGNTGNSGAPHLHFQLTDAKDFFVANGLPVMFENVPAQVMVVEYPVRGNTLSFSDSIFTTVR